MPSFREEWCARMQKLSCWFASLPAWQRFCIAIGAGVLGFHVMMSAAIIGLLVLLRGGITLLVLSWLDEFTWLMCQEALSQISASTHAATVSRCSARPRSRPHPPRRSPATARAASGTSRHASRPSNSCAPTTSSPSASTSASAPRSSTRCKGQTVPGPWLPPSFAPS